MDLRIIDFPEYPWKTLNVHKDFSYTFNISPGKKIEGDLFDSSKMKVVSYNKSTDTGKWIYGFLSFFYTAGRDENGLIFTDKARIYSPEDGCCYDVWAETVGQFTGLRDKNGKEIYEGDIINFTFYSDMAGHAHLENRPEIIRPQIVEFYDCRFVLHDFTLDKENVTYFTFHFSDKFRHRYEIAGNIYDNPNLI